MKRANQMELSGKYTGIFKEQDEFMKNLFKKIRVSIMKKSVSAVVVMFLFIAIPAVCDEIDGQWTGTISRADGSKLEMRYRFKAKGSTLIGLLETKLGGGAISEGKIDGISIEFKIVADGLYIINNGTLSGDEIYLTETLGTQKTKFVLKRVRYDK